MSKLPLVSNVQKQGTPVIATPGNWLITSFPPNYQRCLTLRRPHTTRSVSVDLRFRWIETWCTRRSEDDKLLWAKGDVLCTTDTSGSSSSFPFFSPRANEFFSFLASTEEVIFYQVPSRERLQLLQGWLRYFSGKAENIGYPVASTAVKILVLDPYCTVITLERLHRILRFPTSSSFRKTAKSTQAVLKAAEV